MDEFYYIDPLSIAANGFDLFDVNSNALSVATLGFIKLQVKKITVKRGGGDGYVAYDNYNPKKKEELPNLWKDIEQPIVPDLEKIKELLSNVEDVVEITLEPIHDNVNIENISIYLEPIKETFEKAFPDNKISIVLDEIIIEKEVKKTEVKITLEALNI